MTSGTGGDADGPVLRWVRPFHWGVVIVQDRAGTELPEVPTGTEAARVTGSALLVPVRHASDVDLATAGPDGVVPSFAVRLEVFRAAAPTGVTGHRNRITLPSGVVDVGDADETAELDLGPGTWCVVVDARPVDFPEHVRIWFTRTP